MTPESQNVHPVSEANADLYDRLNSLKVQTPQSVRTLDNMPEDVQYAMADTIARRIEKETDLPYVFRNIADVRQMFNPSSTAIDIIGRSVGDGIQIRELNRLHSMGRLIADGTAGHYDPLSRTLTTIFLPRKPKHILKRVLTGNFFEFEKCIPPHEQLHTKHQQYRFSSDHFERIRHSSELSLIPAEIHSNMLVHSIAIHKDSVSSKYLRKLHEDGIKPDALGFIDTWEHAIYKLRRHYIPYSIKTVNTLVNWYATIIDVSFSSGKVDHADIAQAISDIVYYNENTMWGIIPFAKNLAHAYEDIIEDEDECIKRISHQEYLRKLRNVQIREIGVEEVENAYRKLKNW